MRLWSQNILPGRSTDVRPSILSATFAIKHGFGLRLRLASLSLTFAQVMLDASLKKPNPSTSKLCPVCCSPISLLGCKDDGIYKADQLRASLQILEKQDVEGRICSHLCHDPDTRVLECGRLCARLWSWIVAVYWPSDLTWAVGAVSKASLCGPLNTLTILLIPILFSPYPRSPWSREGLGMTNSRFAEVCPTSVDSFDYDADVDRENSQDDAEAPTVDQSIAKPINQTKLQATHLNKRLCLESCVGEYTRASVDIAIERTPKSTA
ncbi:hypothetical protein KCU95_g45, partial [Aureobasidium melanogenum]